MSRWITWLWHALAAFGEAQYSPTYTRPTVTDDTRSSREFYVDVRDEASLRAAFNSIVEREWGIARFRAGGPADDSEDRQGQPMDRPVFESWPWFFPW